MENSSGDTVAVVMEQPKRRSTVADFFIRLVREKPLGAFGAIVTLLLLFAGIFADVIAPYGMNDTHPADSLSPPSAKYWLGTDNLGRDMLSRIIFGARISVIVGLAAASLATLLSSVIGILSGFFRKFDLIVQRFVDGWMSFPGIIIMIAIITLTGSGMMQTIMVLGLSFGIGASRVTRGAVMGIKENVYIAAAQSVGCTTPRVLLRHVLPNIMALVITSFTTTVPAVILAEASLSFLGLGIPAPAPSWGGMLSGSARSYMQLAPWMSIWPGLALTITVYSVNMFGDALRDLLDPRLRGGVGRYGVKVGKIRGREVISGRKEKGLACSGCEGDDAHGHFEKNLQKY
jgi:peptide/nickel transport system permease protein